MIIKPQVCYGQLFIFSVAYLLTTSIKNTPYISDCDAPSMHCGLIRGAILGFKHN